MVGEGDEEEAIFLHWGSWNAEGVAGSEVVVGVELSLRWFRNCYDTTILSELAKPLARAAPPGWENHT